MSKDTERAAQYDGDTRESRAAFRNYDSVSEPVSKRTPWQIWRDACAWQFAALTQEAQSVPDECPASGQSCSYAPEGRNKEMQCRYCGKEQAAPQSVPAQPVATFPERDASKPAEEQGIFRKFGVRRVDGSDAPGGKHYGCRYFVLDMDCDPHAALALLAYADSCKNTHPLLASNLRAEFTPPAAEQGVPAQPVAKITAADEYGPMIEWRTHWVDLIGKTLYTAPPAAEQDVPRALTDDKILSAIASACAFDRAGVERWRSEALIVARAVFTAAGAK